MGGNLGSADLSGYRDDRVELSGIFKSFTTEVLNDLHGIDGTRGAKPPGIEKFTIVKLEWT